MARRGSVGSFAFAIVLASFAFPQVARASTTWIWPGSAPCDTTLQACVTNAADGDTVLVAQNGAINEQISIVNKGLKLAAEASFTPRINELIVQKTSGTGAVDVMVSRIQVANSILISLSAGAGNTVTLNHVTATSSGADPGVYGTVYVPSTVNVLSSSVKLGGFYAGISLTSPVAVGFALKFNVIGNTISGRGSPNGYAGIALSATHAGSLTGNVYNNVIRSVGQGTSSGSNSGLDLFVRDSDHAEFNVVGNTFNHITHRGILVENEMDPPNHVSLDLFNNIVADTTESAVYLNSEKAGTLLVRSGHNDFYANHHANHTEGHSLGANMSVAPKFVNLSAGNLALQPSSPVINRGITCSPGGVASPDAAGKNRRSGTSVDIGAYEFGAGMPGFVLLGNAGANTLIGGPGNNILCGYGGNDRLLGMGGSDFLDGGSGRDHLFGGPGDDRLFGGLADDLLCAVDGSGGDYLNGGNGTDAYRADPADVKVSVERLGTCKV